MPIKRIEIRWRDLDGFGHVNNSTYLTYLEEARDQHLTDVLGEAVHRTVIRRLEIDFVSGLTQEDDYVDVDVRLTGVGTSSVILEERIVSVLDGRVAATARTVMVHTDDSRTASAPWPDASRDAIDATLAAA
ncbi:MAG TPA: thioesterase family protein [Gaiellales bacterium]|jgi:acyl-CoA thioester hydrolase|nr:thioesterase family protein [Gaiellales bacterium]